MINNQWNNQTRKYIAYTLYPVINLIIVLISYIFSETWTLCQKQLCNALTPRGIYTLYDWSQVPLLFQYYLQMSFPLPHRHIKKRWWKWIHNINGGFAQYICVHILHLRRKYWGIVRIGLSWNVVSHRLIHWICTCTHFMRHCVVIA